MLSYALQAKVVLLCHCREEGDGVVDFVEMSLIMKKKMMHKKRKKKGLLSGQDRMNSHVGRLFTKCIRTTLIVLVTTIEYLQASIVFLYWGEEGRELGHRLEEGCFQILCHLSL